MWARNLAVFWEIRSGMGFTQNPIPWSQRAHDAELRVAGFSAKLYLVHLSAAPDDERKLWDKAAFVIRFAV